MPTKVLMPQMGESIFEGTVTKWLKKVGDKVERDEPLFEISTDKADPEIPAPASGTLKEILVKEGTTVQSNTVVGMLDDGGAPAAAAAPAKEAPKAAPPPPKAEAKPAAGGPPPEGAPAPQPPPPPGGRIPKTDTRGAIEKGPPAARAGAPGAVELGLAVPRERLYFGRYTVEPVAGMGRSLAEGMGGPKRT